MEVYVKNETKENRGIIPYKENLSRILFLPIFKIIEELNTEIIEAK